MKHTTKRVRVARSLCLYTFAAALVTGVCAGLAREPTAAIACAFVGVGALLAYRGRIAGALFLALACAGGLAALVAGRAPSWTFLAALTGAAACAPAAHAMLRRDLSASVALLGLAIGGGASLGWGASELADTLNDPPYESPREGLAVDSFYAPDTRLAAALARREAREDIAAGRLRILTYGYHAGARQSYTDLLEERLGVELDVIAGCVVDGAIEARARGYNEVMVAHLEARHGERILDRLRDEAVQTDEAHRER